MPVLGEIKRGNEIGYKSNVKHIWSACENCRKERWVIYANGLSQTKLCLLCATRTDEHRQKMRAHQLGRHLSPETREKMSIAQRGEKGHHWKGGRIGDGHGYIYIWVTPDSPFLPMGVMVSKRGRTWGGYIREHRLVMAKQVGRCLLKSEMVHHLNGIRDDNRFENLALVSVKSHPKKTFIKQLQGRIRELEQLHLALG